MTVKGELTFETCEQWVTTVEVEGARDIAHAQELAELYRGYGEGCYSDDATTGGIGVLVTVRRELVDSDTELEDEEYETEDDDDDEYETDGIWHPHGAIAYE